MGYKEITLNNFEQNSLVSYEMRFNLCIFSIILGIKQIESIR